MVTEDKRRQVEKMLATRAANQAKEKARVAKAQMKAAIKKASSKYAGQSDAHVKAVLPAVAPAKAAVQTALTASAAEAKTTGRPVGRPRRPTDDKSPALPVDMIDLTDTPAAGSSEEDPVHHMDTDAGPATAAAPSMVIPKLAGGPAVEKSTNPIPQVMAPEPPAAQADLPPGSPRSVYMAGTGIRVDEEVLDRIMMNYTTMAAQMMQSQGELFRESLKDLKNSIASAAGSSTTVTPQVDPSIPRPPKDDPMTIPPVEIPLTAGRYESGTGGVREFQTCEIWQKLGDHGFTAYNARRTKADWKIPDLQNKDQFYEWNLAMEEMLGMFHLKNLVLNLLRNPEHFVEAPNARDDPMRFKLKRKNDVGTSYETFNISPIQMAKIYELNLHMTPALKGAAASLVNERQADHFMDKLFILEHHWGASNPRNKKMFWNEFNTSQYNPTKKTPYEWYHRLSWLLKKCPEVAPSGTVSEQLLRDKLVDGMPHTWAHVINTIHEDPNKNPAHIAQRLENYYQNLRTSSNKAEFGRILRAGITPKAPVPKRQRGNTPQPQPDFPPTPPPAPTPAPSETILAAGEGGAGNRKIYGQCWTCQSPDHYYFNCPLNPNKKKGKDKGDGKGGKNSKGKGGKEGKKDKKGKGKGKGKNSEAKLEN